jgi:hypothetical protein
MAEGKLLPKKEKLRRLQRQHVAYTDPLTNKKNEILYSVVEGGDLDGLPVIEIFGRLVLFELKELAHTAVLLLRREGVLSTMTAEQEAAEKERIEKGFTGFSPVKGD